MPPSTPSQSRRREKPVLSCSFCRGRKLRCDRQSPCSACRRRGKPEDCIYSSSEQGRKDAIDYRPRARRGEQARQRIARLEDLVSEMRDLAQSPQQESQDKVSAQNLAISDAVEIAESTQHLVEDHVGKLSLTEDQTLYTGTSHWATILENIQCLKDELSDDDYVESTKSREPTPFDPEAMHEHSISRISLLTNPGSALSKEQILSMVPSRRTVDRLVSHFFNGFDLAPFFLHRKRFLAEYANFWASPEGTPVMWIGLLFSIMTMSTFLQQQDAGTSEIAESLSALDTYRACTVHCLVAGDYLRPGKYTIQSLILHFGVEQNSNIDADTTNWMLIGLIIRIAMRMGLHRDPSYWPNIRPLQAELRRRLWIALHHMDFFTSTQVGLPRIIKDSQCDVSPPLHLFEDDLGFEVDQMPKERPQTSPTPLFYVIQRDAIIKVAAEIYDATEANTPSSMTIVALNAKIDEAVDAIPEWLKYKPIEKSIGDNPVTILHRIFLDILVHKAIYLLHRRSFVKGAAISEEGSAKSNDLCIKSALAILEHQRKINEETQPGGLMFAIRWKIASSLNHEFLQATMMLCFALSRLGDGQADAPDSNDLIRRDEILTSLATAKDLWEQSADRSAEAKKAANAISVVLRRDLDGSSICSMLDSHASFKQMSGSATPGYIDNVAFDENIALDPGLFTFDNDMALFENMLGDLDTDTDTF